MSWSDLNNVQCLTKNDIRNDVRNYIILEFNTSQATTRSQVLLEDRKLNLLISYNMNGINIIEKYIGQNTADAYWTLDANWMIVSQVDLTRSITMIDLKLPSGRLWASKNIGAESITDYGQHFQWGDIIGYNEGDGKVFSWGSYKYGDSSTALTKYSLLDGLTTLEVEDDAAINNMGGRWRMPDKEDFEEILDSSNCTNSWVTNYNGSGVSGRLFNSVRNNNTLFFPATGYWDDSGLQDVGWIGYYWSRSLGSSIDCGWGMNFEERVAQVDSNSSRSDGSSIRGVI